MTHCYFIYPDNSMGQSQGRQIPADVLEIGLTGPQRAATLMGSSNGVRVAQAQAQAIGVSSEEAVLGLLSADLRGEVLGIADIIDAEKNSIAVQILEAILFT